MTDLRQFRYFNIDLLIILILFLQKLLKVCMNAMYQLTLLFQIRPTNRFSFSKFPVDSIFQQVSFSWVFDIKAVNFVQHDFAGFNELFMG